MTAPAPDPTADTATLAHVPGEPVDENLWLEDIHGADQLAWVREQNARTEELLETGDYPELEARILEVMDSTDRIPMVSKRGDWYYNFWRDAEHPKGLWRRTRWDSYTTETPEWEAVLDLDALAAEEGVEWVWGGASFLRPADGVSWRHCMVRLSPDGGDAAAVREYDVEQRAFVATADGGFSLPPAKGGVDWLDADTLIVSSTLGKDAVTTSSYPRIVRKLPRGVDLADAEVIFEVPAGHMMAAAGFDDTPGFERLIASDRISFFDVTHSIWWEGAWAPISVPTDVDVDLHREWILFRPQRDWHLDGDAETDGQVFPGGSLLVADFEKFMAGSRDVTVLFSPDGHTSLQSWSWTKSHLMLNLLRDVSSEIRVLTPPEGSSAVETPSHDGAWSPTVLDACPPLHLVESYAVDDEDPGAGDDYWLVATGFLTPTTLLRGTLGGRHAEVKRAPSFFDESRFTVEQHFVVSADGTKVPYFQIGPKDLELDGTAPTQLSGYGGFEIARTPSYSGAVGRAWLEKGGVYVVANIRGGGEYGPSWHQAALKANRHRAYEDFAAVARDLVRRDVTSPENLGCTGGSNGGLLVGNMLVSYPQLFGAVSCGVPLLDMRRYAKLSAGYSWIAEYGDPDKPEEWEYIRTFSPYHLLRDGVDYPDTFIWTATSDDRVGPVQARKMAARMEAMGIPNVWFHEALEGGHAGASDNRQAAALQARSQSFLWRALTGTLR
ncbi:prolyl oligopeptidase family serine peptidase [Sinomonas notoginsengisoli]|uniref:prolyl oligopeptidase family serine peptidase n=1 Tax=Sinomonas notoginsengisoli TaxID=1457311 RepID=UPI001F275A5C|nr:prolyl oligopeptidase family serine peptidase [Sinomonas notoginsengisoli]